MGLKPLCPPATVMMESIMDLDGWQGASFCPEMDQRKICFCLPPPMEGVTCVPGLITNSVIAFWLFTTKEQFLKIAFSANIKSMFVSAVFS